MKIDLYRIAMHSRYEPKANPFFPQNLIELASKIVAARWGVRIGLVDELSMERQPLNFADFWGKPLYDRVWSSSTEPNPQTDRFAHLKEKLEVKGDLRETGEDWKAGFLNWVEYEMEVTIGYPAPYREGEDQRARNLLSEVCAAIEEKLEQFEGDNSHALDIETVDMVDRYQQAGLVLYRRVIKGKFRPWRPVPVYNGDGGILF